MPNQRTLKQNNSLHKFCSLVAEELNSKKLDVMKVLRSDIPIWWSTDLVKSLLWKSTQKALLRKSSTTELNNIRDIDVVHKTINDRLKKYDINIPFPSDEGREEKMIADMKKSIAESADGVGEVTEDFI